MRNCTDIYKDGKLWQGYDYINQAWVIDGRYVRCGHPESMNCSCYGLLNEGKEPNGQISRNVFDTGNRSRDCR